MSNKILQVTLNRRHNIPNRKHNLYAYMHIFQSFSHIDIREGCQKNTVWLVFLRLSVVCLGSKLVARGNTVYLVESFHGKR